ncbi:MAG: 2-dehydropantoate 2-reductase [Paludibacter sp.]|nr:2-dehydropantoate 2-reductase [Paludibacter sp.]
MDKIKIVIVGLGGVGGYYGGLLAKKYADNPDIEIYFVARGAHLKKIQEKGLTLITEKGTFQVHPTLATDNVAEIGTADYIIMTPKSYDLDSTVAQIKPIVGANTVVLPLLNGIDNSDRIRTLLPGTEVWQGCCYIVARLNEPGVVESSGGVHRFNFGYEHKQTNERLTGFESLLKEAGIDATFYENILHVIWTKFFFISSTASLTSYFNVSFGALLTDETRKATLVSMLEELILIANAEGAEIERTVIDKVIHQLEKLPFETTSSMHSDFKAGKTTEVHGLTGSVVELGKKLGIPTPTYLNVYNELLKR